jgi:hypothetical protein
MTPFVPGGSDTTSGHGSPGPVGPEALAEVPVAQQADIPRGELPPSVYHAHGRWRRLAGSARERAECSPVNADMVYSYVRDLLE